MAKPKFSVGQRAFVSTLNPNHSIYKKQWFLGRVVTIINVREQRNDFRYFIKLATNKRYTMFILEKHLEPLSNQELTPRDRADLLVNNASEVPQFDKKSLPIPDTKELLWEAYMVMDHGDHDERLIMLKKLEDYFDRVGKPTETK